MDSFVTPISADTETPNINPAITKPIRMKLLVAIKANCVIVVV